MTSKIEKKSLDCAETGRMGQSYLVEGEALSMRMWTSRSPTHDKAPRTRDYETVGYVLEGRAELRLGGDRTTLEPGDSWVVPKGAEHTYEIIEPFTAVEVTSPPARERGRDEAVR